jgi:hypothetical protein
MDFKAKLTRMCRLRIRGKFFNYSIICVHAPTEEKNGEEKMPFMMTWIRPMRSVLGEMSK